jgi:hypothetical protein
LIISIGSEIVAPEYPTINPRRMFVSFAPRRVDSTFAICDHSATVQMAETGSPAAQCGGASMRFTRSFLSAA